MPVRFVLGRAGTGKTRHCLDAILNGLACPNDTHKLLFLVPEQASFQMERALALRAPGGGYWRAEVLSFSRLARRIFDELGTPPVELSPRGRRMALRVVAGRCGGALHAFGKAAGTAGFYAELDRLIEELLAENVTPEQLRGSASIEASPVTAPDPRKTGEEARAAESPLFSMNVEENTLADVTSLLSAKAGERVLAIADIYSEYLTWLGVERVDPAARLAALRERLGRVEWLRDAAIWVDGFAGFTGQELETLVSLARGAREMEITLLLDPAALHEPLAGEDGLRLFARTEMTYRRLKARLDEAGVELRPAMPLDSENPRRFAASAELGRLERAFGSSHGQVRSDLPTPPTRRNAAVAHGVRIVECGTHRDELREAARLIRTSVIEAAGATRFRDFAIIARDLTPIAHIVTEVFDEFDIPFFLDRRRPMSTHALCRLVRGLLEAATSDCASDAMVRLLRSGLLLPRDDAEELENVVLASEVHGLEAWRRARWEFENGAAGPRQLDAARRRIVRCVEGLHALARRKNTVAEPAEFQPGLGGASRPDGGSALASDWVRQLLAAIEETGAVRRLEAWIAEAHAAGHYESAEVHRLAWESLCELFDDIDGVLGATALSASEFSEIVTAALGELSLGLAPPTLDQVLVGSIERSRHPEIKHAWLIAFNEGVFPKPPGDDGLLATADREALAAAGLDGLRPRREDALAERMLAYIAYSRPSHGLTISFARAGEDGQPMSPSPLLEDVRRALPDVGVESADETSPPACLTAFARGYLRYVPGPLPARLTATEGSASPTTRSARSRPSITKSGESGVDAATGGATSVQYRAVVEALAKDPETLTRLNWLLRGTRYDNLAPPLTLSSRCKAGETTHDDIVWHGSPSEIETYIQCPFKHFAEQRLRLQARRGPQPIEWELGHAAHEILAEVTRRAIAESKSVRTLSDQRWIEILEAVIEQQDAAQPADIAQRRPHVAFLRQTLGEMLRETVLAHAERWRRGSFEPLATERSFRRGGGAEDLPPLSVALPGGYRALLEGRIDRLDYAETADGAMRVLVYDYKSSGMRLDGAYLTGARLASFAYLLAVEQAYGAEGRVAGAGALIAPLFPDPYALRKKYAAEADPATQRLYALRPRGLFDQDAAARLDEQLTREQAERRQKREQTDDGAKKKPKRSPGDGPPPAPSPVAAIRIKMDGEFDRYSDARPGSEIAARGILARRTISEAVEKLTGGRIEIEPLVENRTLACRACDFKPLCRFDPLLNRPRAAETHLPVLVAIEPDKDEANSRSSATEAPA